MDREEKAHQICNTSAVHADQTGVEQRRSGKLLMFPIAITMLLGLGLGSVVVIANERETQQISAVDAIGAEFLSDAATFRTSVAAALKPVDADDPTALLRTLNKAIATPPKLEAADAELAELSSTYQQARIAEKGLLNPYRQLKKILVKSQRAQSFFDAATAALKLDPSDYVSSTVLQSSTELRGQLIPTFVAERDKFASVPVPAGAESCAAQVAAALQEVIDGATQLANSIDARQGGSAQFGAAHARAVAGLPGCQAKSGGDLTEALDRVQE